MYPLIPRFTEVARNGSGTINHAIRITVGRDKVRCTDGNELCDRRITQTPTVTAGFPQGYIWPASHSDGAAPTTTPAALPMGSHLRLQPTYTLVCPTNTPCPQAQVFVTALKQYGAIIADTDGAGYGNMGLHAEWTPDGGWTDSDIIQLQTIPIKAFEVVDATRSGCLDSYVWCPACANLCSP